MEIHARYYESTVGNISNNIPSNSDKLFELIRMNKIGEILLLFQTIPNHEISRLVNTKNSNYNGMHPLNFAIKCSANHLILVMLLRLGSKSDDSLLLTVKTGLVNSFKLLIIAEWDVNVLDEDGYSIIHWAAFKNNVLLVRLILKLTDFTFHNHDRNKQRISPLGIAINQKNINLLKELLKSPKIDPNIIDSHSHEYVYDLAAESGQYNACVELELAFTRRNSHLSKRSIERTFHNLHKYTIEAYIQHQFRSAWFSFKDDPRGAYQPIINSSQRLFQLPGNKSEWKVVSEDGSLDEIDGWTYGFTCGTENPYIINFKGDQVVESGTLFNYLDNYRFRILTRIKSNKLN